jgi:hypothetical protein
MAHDNGASGVEFVGDTNDDAPDEELPEPPHRQRNNPRWALAGGAVLLVGAALIARAVSHGNELGNPSPSPSSSAAIASPTAGASVNGEPIVAPESNRPILDPRRIPFAAPLCQPPAGCSQAATLPGATADALHTAYPDVVVRTASTVLSTRPDKMAPDVVVRTITAQAGSAAITIRIRMAVPIDSREVEQHRGAVISTTKVAAISLGYFIQIEVSRTGSPAPVATVQSLASDGRLVLPS